MKIKLLRIAMVAALMLAAITMGHAQEVPITVHEGWNWISYPKSEPMSVNEAFSGFTPMQGDMIKSESDGYALYRNGNWLGSLTTLYPGRGYHYQSVDGTTRTFIFGGAANDPSALPEAALEGDFTVDANGTKVRFSPGNLQCLIDPDMNKEAVVGIRTSSNSYFPYATNYNYSLCEMIYTAEELAAAGLAPGPIKSIAFRSNSDLCLHRNNIRVWLSNTTATTVGYTSVSTSGMTMVFEGSVTQQPGWTEIPCGGTFSWDGTSNVRVTVVMNHGSHSDPYIYWDRDETDFNSCGYAHTNTNNGGYRPESTTYSLTPTNKRSVIRFKGNGVRWRFATNQTDYIGAANENIGPTYHDWIDLFGWGTSGYNHGAVCYQPWSTSETNSDYYAYGSATYNLNDQTGQADWGYNPISNGGNKPGQWRTLTADEWGYVLYTRSTASGIRFAAANVNEVNGVILLPDNWSNNYYTLNNPNIFLPISILFSANTITSSQWSTLEQHGAVFLPAVGYRNGTSVGNVGNVNYSGNYWSASSYDSDKAKCLHFYWSLQYLEQTVMGLGNIDRYRGGSVRLVCQSNPRIRTIGVSNVQGSAATVTAEVDCTGSATVGERGVCWASYPSPSLGNSHATSGTGTGGYSVNLSNLASGTTYYVRAYATIGDNTVYGNELNFISQADLITVTTSEVADVKQTTALGKGNVSGTGISTMTEHGVCWSVNHNPTTSDRHVTCDAMGTGNFYCMMTNLTPNTTYYMRAYATNNAGTSYGSELSFTTTAVAAPTVTTSVVTDIAQITAIAGGTVTNEGGAPVTNRGFCWGTSSNPTISGSHSSAGTGLGSFTKQITGLYPSTTYYVRAYATNSQGTSYGSQISFTTDAPPTGTINGLFSVSATRKVYFSRGNLQYKASTNTWRFATNQYDYIGSNNSNISSSYSGWIDLFGWGTSGYNHGAVCYQPWSTSQTNSDYFAYGSSTYNLNDQTGKADWGYNPISNGGNTSNQWRTLTDAELTYVFQTRTTTSGIRYAKAKVNNVNGVILLPDDWSSSIYSLSNTNNSWASFSSNTISVTQWATLESAGAVFLPAAGGRNGASVNNVGSYGNYWSASYYLFDYARSLYFDGSDLYQGYFDYRYSGFSVRLVRNAE